MKLVPDALTSALEKVLPFGGSRDAKDNSASTPGASEPAIGSEPETDAPAEAVAEAQPESTSEPYDAETEEPADKPEPEHEGEPAAEADHDEPEQETSAAGAAAVHQDADESSDDGLSNSESDSEEDVSDITAPSIGPNTVIDLKPPEERLDLDKISDTDAMGNDKRREVVGQRYSASPARQVVAYALFVVIVIAIVIGGKALATKLDEPPKQVKAAAPWNGNNVPVRRLDFPQYGEPAS